MPTYVQVTKDGAAITKGLMLIWERLGRPKDVSVNTGWVMMDNIVQVWMKCFPEELLDFNERLQNELSDERTVKEAHKAAGGYFPISYPPRLYTLMKTMLPDIKYGDKKFIKQMTSRYPIFKTTNYSI